MVIRFQYMEKVLMVIRFQYLLSRIAEIWFQQLLFRVFLPEAYVSVRSIMNIPCGKPTDKNKIGSRSNRFVRFADRHLFYECYNPDTGRELGEKDVS